MCKSILVLVYYKYGTGLCGIACDSDSTSLTVFVVKGLGSWDS